MIENAGSSRQRVGPAGVHIAESEEDVGRLIHEAIELHLEGLEEDGLPISEPSSRVEYIEVTA